MHAGKRELAGSIRASADDKSLREYQADLTRVLGPVVGGLGLRTQTAFRKAHVGGRLPHTFVIPGRRGRFAATADIAAWLWAQRHQP